MYFIDQWVKLDSNLSEFRDRNLKIVVINAEAVLPN